MADSKVVILSGSSSDDNIVQKVVKVLEENNVVFESHVASAHRQPDLLDEILKKTSSYAYVYVCIAGLSAALPGVVASKVKQPVIGVPVSSKLGGLDALLSIVQMPPGVPVATVGIDNGKNAAHLAIRIINIIDKN